MLDVLHLFTISKLNRAQLIFFVKLQHFKTTENIPRFAFMEDDFDWDSAFADNFEGEEHCNPAKKPKLEGRKFPGPAGILPKGQPVSRAFANSSEKADAEIEEAQQSLSREELLESNSAWHELEKNEDFGAERLKFDSEFIKNEVKRIGSSFKIPMFCTVLKSIDLSSGLDPSCEFVDNKGEISGMIHRDVLDEYGEQLRPGNF